MQEDYALLGEATDECDPVPIEEGDLCEIERQ